MIENIALNLINWYNDNKILFIFFSAWNLKSTPKKNFDLFIQCTTRYFVYCKMFYYYLDFRYSIMSE